MACGATGCGTFRVICELDDERMSVMVLGIGHRSTIYE
jgi:mRNA-degrading endonuclease RelE of RelBE toxin-antitoxin system